VALIVAVDLRKDFILQPLASLGQIGYEFSHAQVAAFERQEQIPRRISLCLVNFSTVSTVYLKTITSGQAAGAHWTQKEN